MKQLVTMKFSQHNINLIRGLGFLLFTVFFIGNSTNLSASNLIEKDTVAYNEYRGEVLDAKSKKELIFATISVNNTNISTITNTQGEFLLKVPQRLSNSNITISFLGYTSKVMNLTEIYGKETSIRLETYIEELDEVKVSFKDPNSLIREMLRKKGDNYFDFAASMTAFYRETIKKRKTYVSLSEAVVDINKQSYTNSRNDLMKLFKARKSTDYKKLDTIALKLKGGPFSTLYLDIMKNAAPFFDDYLFEEYDFTLMNSTKIDNRPIYVVNFKQKPFIDDPLYFGTLYIDANTYALTKATFQMNLENEEEASKIFVIKKPTRAKVTPIHTQYQIDYRVKDGKWYYGYSRIELGFKVNWDKRLFNSIYYSTMEMAITDWERLSEATEINRRERLRTSIILSDEASGFSDPEFWGEYNVIEPEKPIESAIKKIQRKLNRGS